MTTAANLARREELERRFDGPIPAHLADGRTEAEIEVGHHRAMVRYCDQRIADYTASLAKIESWTDGDTKTIWLRSTRENLDDMHRTKAHHEAQIAAVTAEAQPLAAE